MEPSSQSSSSVHDHITTRDRYRNNHRTPGWPRGTPTAPPWCPAPASSRRSWTAPPWCPASASSYHDNASKQLLCTPTTASYSRDATPGQRLRTPAARHRHLRRLPCAPHWLRPAGHFRPSAAALHTHPAPCAAPPRFLPLNVVHPLSPSFLCSGVELGEPVGVAWCGRERTGAFLQLSPSLGVPEDLRQRSFAERPHSQTDERAESHKVQSHPNVSWL